jgi:hypothetical protein
MLAAVVSYSSEVGTDPLASTQMIVPPYRCTAATFDFKAIFGIAMYAGMPRVLAASDRAAAWLPDELVTTP